MLPDEKFLAPGLTIVEEEASSTDLGGNPVPNESKVNQYESCLVELILC